MISAQIFVEWSRRRARRPPRRRETAAGRGEPRERARAPGRRPRPSRSRGREEELLALVPREDPDAPDVALPGGARRRLREGAAREARRQEGREARDRGPHRRRDALGEEVGRVRQVAPVAAEDLVAA